MQLVVVGSAWDSDCDQENEAMSQFNGDKARFNRERKQNIQRRKRNKALFQAAGISATGIGAPGAQTSQKPRRVTPGCAEMACVATALTGTTLDWAVISDTGR